MHIRQSAWGKKWEVFTRELGIGKGKLDDVLGLLWAKEKGQKRHVQGGVEACSKRQVVKQNINPSIFSMPRRSNAHFYIRAWLEKKDRDQKHWTKEVRNPYLQRNFTDLRIHNEKQSPNKAQRGKRRGQRSLRDIRVMVR